MGIVLFSTDEHLNNHLHDIELDGVNISEYMDIRDSADKAFNEIKSENFLAESEAFQKAADNLVQSMQKLSNKAKSSGIEKSDNLDQFMSAVEHQLAYVYIGYLSSIGRLNKDNVKRKISGLKDFMDKFPG